MRRNIVLDTNTVLSAMLFSNSITAQAYEKAIFTHQLVLSTVIWNEYIDVLSRTKFDRYLGLLERLVFSKVLKQKAIFVEPTESITDCRDPKDNKFLELAVASDAQFIITGDEDLLVLNPYRGITVLKSGDFLVLELT